MGCAPDVSEAQASQPEGAAAPRPWRDLGLRGASAAVLIPIARQVNAMYLLDTNVVSELRRPKPHGAVLAWFEGLEDTTLHLSAVTIGEIQT